MSVHVASRHVQKTTIDPSNRKTTAIDCKYVLTCCNATFTRYKLFTSKSWHSCRVASCSKLVNNNGNDNNNKTIKPITSIDGHTNDRADLSTAKPLKPINSINSNTNNRTDASATATEGQACGALLTSNRGSATAEEEATSIHCRPRRLPTVHVSLRLVQKSIHRVDNGHQRMQERKRRRRTEEFIWTSCNAAFT